MKLNVHIIMGFNQDSIRPAIELQRRHEVVYICDNSIQGVVHKRKDFTFVNQQFVDAIDHTTFKVFTYEPPYKKGQVLQGTRSFMMERTVNSSRSRDENNSTDTDI
ncbi:hypothetical protein [Paenisporosarcina sp. TG20]|uniref:hypothetical protein n=1 Tax=Paenisporosarcina sp. TG20 TaxID=1211706 RepID=UPI0003064D3C|nr:hypothetical protein [Paenisporosarcina sp. TG20]